MYISKKANSTLYFLIAAALMLTTATAEAKSLTWPDNGSGDPEDVLRMDTIDHIDNSLFINSVASGNTINVISGNIGGDVFAGYTTTTGATADHDTVNIMGGTIGSSVMFSGNVAGGISYNGDAVYNTVNMTGGTVKGSISGGESYDGNANYNTVNISGGTVGTVAGGFVSDANSNSSARYNVVNITGGTITGNIYGGDSNNGIDSNNTVNISGNVRLSPTATIAGGTSATGMLLHPENTLNIAWAGAIGSINHFQYINFTVNDAVINNNNTAITVNNSANINGSNIKIVAFENTTPLNVGSSITLLSRSTGTGILYGGSVRQGLARYFDYELSTVGAYNAVVANIVGSGVVDEVGDIPSGGGATSSLLKSGADLIDSAVFIDEVDGQSKLIAIAKHSYDKIGSGSSFDVKSTAMLVGTSKKFAGNKGYIAVGGFIEGGWGTFDTRSNFSSNIEINSNGRSNYHGGGIVVGNFRDNGFYNKLTIRAGRAFTHYNSVNLRDTNNNLASYDSSAFYYGANLAIGKVIKVNQENNLDVYGKYLFLHQGGSTVNILGDTFDLKAINSHRMRVGAKLTNTSNKYINSYIDLAYEYEFAGQSKAVTYGTELPYVSTKGATAIAELGVVYKPKNHDKFEMRMGMQGYVGKRQGMGGTMELKWKF